MTVLLKLKAESDLVEQLRIIARYHEPGETISEMDENGFKVLAILAAADEIVRLRKLNQSVAHDYAEYKEAVMANSDLGKTPCPNCGSEYLSTANPAHRQWRCGSWKKANGTSSRTITCHAFAQQQQSK